jgi:hypothetical protein
MYTASGLRSAVRATAIAGAMLGAMALPLAWTGVGVGTASADDITPTSPPTLACPYDPVAGDFNCNQNGQSTPPPSCSSFELDPASGLTCTSPQQ